VARVSVVVPVYNVEDYLQECLESIAGQTFRDLECVMVNDGSTDSSPEIAAAFAAQDDRFRLVSQPNAGLGAARNTGTANATGEFLAFVDSDDVLTPRAYELLVGALDESGSDFATGNIQRLTTSRTRQAWFVSHAFTHTKLQTHVLQRRELLADRTAWNKLFRRAFWDAHGYTFPVGVFNEDIPVTIPAHFAAKSVDVIAEPIYLWRSRPSGGSITQRRLDMKALQDRFSAVENTLDILEREAPPKGVLWYEQSVVADDLRYHLDLLHKAEPEYIEEFMRRSEAFFARARPGVLDRLHARERRKWERVRAGDAAGAIALLEAQRRAGPTLRKRVFRRIPETWRRRLRGAYYELRRS
jgi:CDP-glycerol glycerophosphotransferase